MQCEWLRQIALAVPGDEPLLIVCPLGVRQELIRDAAMLGIELRFIRSADEIEAGHRFYITNYETVRDGKLDPRLFLAVSLDEASVLRSFGSKTYHDDGRAMRDANGRQVFESQTDWLAHRGGEIHMPAAPVQRELFA